jgi:hypothetical protein
MPSQVVNVAEGKELNISLGFVANSVTINNLTQSWCYEKQSQTFIPPYQYGVVIPIPGTDTGDIQWRTPTSLPVGPVGSGVLSATYTSASLVPSNGVSVFTQQTQIVLGVVPTSGFTTFVLPGGCQGLLITQISATTGVAVTVTGVTTGNNYFSGTSPPGLALIVPVSPTSDRSVTVTDQRADGGLSVIALFTSPPEPVTLITTLPPANASTNLTEIGGTAVSDTVPGMLDVNLQDVGGVALAAHAAGAVPVDIQDIGGTAVSNVVPGTLDVNIKDVAGSAAGVLNVNIADLKGSASVVGQQLMAASFPVVIASDDTVAENLTQIKGVAVGASLGGAFAGVLPVEGFSFYTSGIATAFINAHLQTMQRPTMSVLSTRISVVVAGGVLIAAPGVGSSIVLRKLRFSVSAAALAADVIVFGTALTGATLARFEIPVGAAAQPQQNVYAMDWDDFLIGDNLPVDVSSNVATFTNVSIIITYSVVATASWPTS